MKPRELLETARLLAKNGRRPRQSDLKRAISTAYYALFHVLARCCADNLIGGTSANRSEPAWVQVYRALDHNFAKDVCKKTAIISLFPQEIQDFAGQFIAMQEKRHAADYDPTTSLTRSDVLNDINIVEATIRDFEATSVRDRTAFAAYVLFKRRH